jgi:hypothetical protein
VVRQCRHHGLVVFHRYSNGGGGSVYRCKRCIGEAVTRRHRKLKRLLVDENGGGCAVCGYDRCIGNLHFHHVDPSQKSLALDMAGGGRWRRIARRPGSASWSARTATERSRPD